MTTIALLLIGAIPILALAHGFRTGRSIVRFPRPTYRDENPVWFWSGQLAFATMAAVAMLLAFGISN